MPIWITGEISPLGIIQSGKSAIQLHSGETVRALVKDVTNQEVVLLIRGHQVEAVTDVPLRAGERLNLQVVEIKEGRMVFQVVQENPPAFHGTASPQLTAEGLLNRHGLNSSPGNLLLAQTLLDNGLVHIPREALVYLSKMLTANPSREEVQALVQLFSKGQPVHHSRVTALQALIELFTNDTAFSRSLANSGAFNRWNGNLPMGANTNMPAELLFKAAAKGSPNLWSELTISLGEEKQPVAEKLAALPTRLGLDYESQLPDRLNPPVNRGDGQIRDVAPSLKEILLQYEATANPQSPETGQAVRSLIQVLTGLQLLHLGQADQGYVYLMGWMNWQDGIEASPFFLSFFQDPRGGQGPGEPGRQVMLKTQTPRLGSILGELRIFGNYLSVQFAVETVETQTAFNRYAPQLATMMEDLPWTVHILPCRLASKQEKSKWWDQFVEPAVPQRLDVRL